MSASLENAQQQYADLLINVGLNLQPGQSVRVSAELAHAPLVRLVTEVAYRAGAPYVQVDWIDMPLMRARLKYARPGDLTYFPAYEVTRHQQMLDETWVRLALVGDEFPDLLADVDPVAMRTVAETRSRKLKFYMQAMMANHMQWCVAAAPTAAWAAKVFPELAPDAAVERLWSLILRTCRADQPDPVAAWQQHDATLKRVADFLMQHQVRKLHFLDTAPGPDGKPATDLTIGLTDRPQWLGGSGERTPDGLIFFPNMPTEEVFTTPDSRVAEGYVRLSRTAFPFERAVKGASFRFAGGEVVGYDAASGKEVLDQFFAMAGTKRLGEVALVDVRSPVSRAGVVFYEILFDENAACHIAFGEAYPDAVVGGTSMSQEELQALGVNVADAHLDVMIGTPTLRVTGHCLDGSTVTIMEKGQFVPAAAESRAQ
jgi:aminopeptidase